MAVIIVTAIIGLAVMHLGDMHPMTDAAMGADGIATAIGTGTVANAAARGIEIAIGIVDEIEVERRAVIAPNSPSATTVLIRRQRLHPASRRFALSSWPRQLASKARLSRPIRD